jgi:hypothetical protein
MSQLSASPLTAKIRAPFWVQSGLGPSSMRPECVFDNGFSLKWRNYADTADITFVSMASDNSLRFTPGSGNSVRFDNMVKFMNQPTADAFGVQLKTEPTIVTGTHAGLEATLDAKPSTATSAAGIRAVQAVTRLAATYTMTSGSLIAIYGQVQNLGTLNGSGIMVAAAYSLLATGGTYTAVSHVCSTWIDSQLAVAVSAGNTELLYMTNNGATTLDSAIFLYPGNKITNLITIDPTATGMVSANDAGGSTLDFTNWRLITIKIAGETHYLVAAKTIANS